MAAAIFPARAGIPSFQTSVPDDRFAVICRGVGYSAGQHGLHTILPAALGERLRGRLRSMLLKQS